MKARAVEKVRHTLKEFAIQESASFSAQQKFSFAKISFKNGEETFEGGLKLSLDYPKSVSSVDTGDSPAEVLI